MRVPAALQAEVHWAARKAGLLHPSERQSGRAFPIADRAPPIASAALTGVVPPEIERAGLPTNPIYALDLALFLPLCIVAAVGLIRRTPAAAAFALPMLIWLFLTSVGVVGAFVFAAAAGDAFPVAPAVLVTAIGVLTGGLALVGIIRGSREAFPFPTLSVRRVISGQ